MNVQDIAKVVHTINKAYCESLKDFSQVDWEKAPENIKQSAIDGVNFIISNPDVGPDASHSNWLKFKEADGWKYGPVKDMDKKEHPCFVPYDDLPQEQKSKDYLFKATVKSLLPFLAPEVPDSKQATGIVHSFGEDGKRYADLSNMTTKPL